MYMQCFTLLKRIIYIYMYTGLFEMIIGVLITCHTQYT